LTKSLKIIEEAEVRVFWDRRLFLVLCVLFIILIIATAKLDLNVPFAFAFVV
jgi:hypothetical protein